MSNFEKFSKKVNDQLTLMSASELFTVDIDSQVFWEAYLSAFPSGTNPMYKERTEYDCNCCKSFIKKAGRLVSIVGGKIVTVWDLEGLEYPFDVVAGELNKLVKKAQIQSLFVTDIAMVSQAKSRQLVPDTNEIKEWNHFHFKFTGKHFNQNNDRVIGEYGTTMGVFKRGLEELTLDSLTIVLDLITSDNLYRGSEHLPSLKAFIKIKKAYEKLKTQNEKSIFIWENAKNPNVRFRNTVIGTLCTDISEGVELERAVKAFETKLAPSNYKRSKSLITPAMVKSANAKIQELELAPSLPRRMAVTEDVSINNVIYADHSVLDKMIDTDDIMNLLSDQVTKGRGVTAKNKGTDISIEDFIKKVVPKAHEMELLLENSLSSNLMTLTAPQNESPERLFKWDNNFAWSYKGNVTDSVKERVKAAGGSVEGDLRVSLSWFNYDDLDIHCKGVDGHLYFGNKRGILDVDMNAGTGDSREPVENLSWTKPKLGTRTIVINNFSKRETIDVGFDLQVEYLGEITNYHYNLPVTSDVHALELNLTKEGLTVKVLDSKITSESVSTKVWGLDTKEFHKINMMMLSPNYWDDQKEIGNKHYFFILEDCLNDESCRGIYNEYLRSDLNEHRKVFEILADKTKCEVSDRQLSGVGVSSTMNKTVRIKVKADTTKMYNVTF